MPSESGLRYRNLAVKCRRLSELKGNQARIRDLGQDSSTCLLLNQLNAFCTFRQGNFPFLWAIFSGGGAYPVPELAPLLFAVLRQDE